MAVRRAGAALVLGAALAFGSTSLAAEGGRPGIDRSPTHSTVPANAPHKTVSRCAHEWRELKRTGEAVDLTWRRFWETCSTAP